MCVAGMSGGIPIVSDNIKGGLDAVSLEQGARQEESAANERTRRIRAASARKMAEQRIQFLANGVEGGSGSALEVGKADAAELELDALTELYGGTSKAATMREQGRVGRDNTFQALHARLSPSRWVGESVFGKNNPSTRLDKAVWGYSRGSQGFGFG